MVFPSRWHSGIFRAKVYSGSVAKRAAPRGPMRLRRRAMQTTQGTVDNNSVAGFLVYTLLYLLVVLACGECSPKQGGRDGRH